jgi:hypothetical protein
VQDEPNRVRTAYTFLVPTCGDLRHKKLECSPFPLRSSLCPAPHGEARGCRDIVIQEKCDRAPTSWPTRARAQPAPPWRRMTSFGGRPNPRGSGASDLLPVPIRDSMTLDNCPSAVEPLSFVPLLDGHPQLMRIGPCGSRKCPDWTPTAHSLSCRFATGFARDEDIAACRTRALASS